MDDKVLQMAMLDAIAKHVSLSHPSKTSIDQLKDDSQLLHSQIQEIRVNWHQIAESLNVSRDKLYHWYYETHLRNSSRDRITPLERNQMQQLILQAVQSKEIIDLNYQQKLKQQVFGDKDIHRSDFSMAFNNLIRTKVVRQALEKYNCEIPTMRNKKNGEVHASKVCQNDQESFSQSMSQVEDKRSASATVPKGKPNVNQDNLKKKQNQKLESNYNVYKNDDEEEHILNNDIVNRQRSESLGSGCLQIGGYNDFFPEFGQQNQINQKQEHDEQQIYTSIEHINNQNSGGMNQNQLELQGSYQSQQQVNTGVQMFPSSVHYPQQDYAENFDFPFLFGAESNELMRQKSNVNAARSVVQNNSLKQQNQQQQLQNQPLNQGNGECLLGGKMEDSEDVL